MKTWVKVLIGIGIVIGLYLIFLFSHTLLGFPGVIPQGSGLEPSENQFESSSLTSFLCRLQGDRVYHYCDITYGESSDLEGTARSEFTLFCDNPSRILEYPELLASCENDCGETSLCSEPCDQALDPDACEVRKASCKERIEECRSHCNEIYSKGSDEICTIINTGYGGACEPDSEWYTHSECVTPPLM